MKLVKDDFLWKLYKESPDGQAVIAQFQNMYENDVTPVDSLRLVRTFNGDSCFGNSDDVLLPTYNFYQHYVLQKISEKKVLEDEAENFIQKYIQFYIDIVSDILLMFTDNKFSDIDDIPLPKFREVSANALRINQELSLALYQFLPDLFVPNLMVMNFHYIKRFFEKYELDLPEIPTKPAYYDRIMYYLQICLSLFEFRIENELSPAELCALVYDMEVQAAKKEIKPMPQTAERVWLVGGAEPSEEETNWQCNPEVRKGDIVLFYSTSKTKDKNKRSCITSVWRALEDGRIDPFFGFYKYTKIGCRINIPVLRQKLFETDERTNKWSIVTRNFETPANWQMTSANYYTILDLIKEQDCTFNLELLPKLFKPTYIPNVVINDEHDVEEQLIVPMLNDMGWGEEYKRQVSVQVGRKKDNTKQSGRTDFSLFNYDDEGGKKRCHVMIETKYSPFMTRKDQIRETFNQGESYADLQHADLLILIDDTKILLYTRKNGRFEYTEDPIKFDWSIREDRDKFMELKKIIEKYKE